MRPKGVVKSVPYGIRNFLYTGSGLRFSFMDHPTVPVVRKNCYIETNYNF
jgi:hypothetical protein